MKRTNREQLTIDIILALVRADRFAVTREGLQLGELKKGYDIPLTNIWHFAGQIEEEIASLQKKS